MLSKKAQYSILALTYLAKNNGKEPVLICDIVASEKLPRKFLEAILIDLKKMGLVNSKKGKGGGYYLIKKPSEIRFADIVRYFDGAIALLPCVTFNYYEECKHCKDENTCGIRTVVRQIRDETVTLLKKYTLQDVLDKDGLIYT